MPGLSFLVLRFSGSVDAVELSDAAARTLESLPPGTPYRSLIVFDPDTELSELNNSALEGIHVRSEEIRRRRNLGPRMGAAALNDSADAMMIAPLYNAVNLARASEDLGLELFKDLHAALDHLGIPLNKGLEVLARTR